MEHHGMSQRTQIQILVQISYSERERTIEIQLDVPLAPCLSIVTEALELRVDHLHAAWLPQLRNTHLEQDHAGGKAIKQVRALSLPQKGRGQQRQHALRGARRVLRHNILLWRPVARSVRAPFRLVVEAIPEAGENRCVKD